MGRRASFSGGEIPALPLTLVGGVHGDERGFTRTLRFLQTFQPDLVLVELSPYGKVFRERHQRALQRKLNENLAIAAGNTNLTYREALTHSQIRPIRRQLALPFEYRAARRFSRTTGNPFLLIDYSPFSRRLIGQWPELLSIANLSLLLTLPRDTRSTPDRTYDLAARTIRQTRPPMPNCPQHAGSGADVLWSEREQFLAARVRSALERFRPSRAVYLGGWQHLTAEGRFPSLRLLLGLEKTPAYLLDRGFL